MTGVTLTLKLAAADQPPARFASRTLSWDSLAPLPRKQIAAILTEEILLLERTWQNAQHSDPIPQPKTKP